MHDTKNKTVEALPMIIDYAKSNGYTFKSIDINTMPLMQKVNNQKYMEIQYILYIKE